MLGAALVVLVLPAAGQSAATLGSEARFTKAPGRTVLGTLLAGADVSPGKRSGAYTEVTFDGWLPSASLGSFARDGFDAVVRHSGGEQLRRTPEGTPVARLVNGAGVLKKETRGSWTRVQRSAWVEQKALVSAPAAAAPTAPALPGGVSIGRRTELRVEAGGTEIGTVDSGVPARVVAQTEGWSRVQLEVWVPDSTLQAADSGILRGVSQAEVRANPARYIGRTLEWRLQFVAVQKADELRPEIPMGQPYLLTRGPLPEPGFVYVVVPSSQVARFEALPALKEIVVRGRLQAASSKYLPTPILNLVSVVDGVAN